MVPPLTCRTGRNIRIILDSGLFPALYENMTSYTKPETHNISHCCQRRTESWPPVTCTENLVKFGLHFLRYASRRTYRQTNKHTKIQTGRSQYFAPLPTAQYAMVTAVLVCTVKLQSFTASSELVHVERPFTMHVARLTTDYFVTNSCKVVWQ